MGAFFKHEFQPFVPEEVAKYVKNDYIITVENFNTKKTFKAKNLKEALKYLKKHNDDFKMIIRGYDPDTKQNVWTYDPDNYEFMSDIARGRL